MNAAVLRLGASALVRQGATLGFRHLVLTDSSLVLVTKGTKIVRHAGVEVCAAAGDVVAVPAGIACDVINVVDGGAVDGGPVGVEAAASGTIAAGTIVTGAAGEEGYVALALTFDRDLLAALPRAADGPPAIIRPTHIADPPEAFRAALLRAAEAAEPDSGLPDPVARHRIAEPLAWLPALAGGGLAAPAASLSMRLRALLAADPGHSWSASDAARRLGMSGSAMRRHLAKAGAGFAEVLADVRMTRALALIQASGAPITAIAAEVGYQSQSRFAVRFRQRFGFAPTAIRGHRRGMIVSAPKSIGAGAPSGAGSASMAQMHAHEGDRR